MKCWTCNGSGIVVEWNLRDDSGDGVTACHECGGYGLVPEETDEASVS